jgi:diguanylate cyclase (GGDEF)-like protein
MIIAQTWSELLSAPVMLALVAVIGYLVGQLTRARAKLRSQGEVDLSRALAVAQELDMIGRRLQAALSAHLPAVIKFNRKVARMERMPSPAWHELSDRADELLTPALRLSSEISHAYAEILQQMSHLAAFAELRTDPLTSIYNRRAFDESLLNCLSQDHRYGTTFSLALLDIDLFKRVNDQHGHLHGDRILQELGQLLKAEVRECDIVARFGGEEFVILMPQTELRVACNMAERVRGVIRESLPITVSIGVAGGLPNDTASSLLNRADAALYSAKNAGRNCVHINEGPSGIIVAIKGAPAPKPAPTASNPRPVACQTEVEKGNEAEGPGLELQGSHAG